MPYITDAAREYAKKKLKDSDDLEKILFEAFEDKYKAYAEIMKIVNAYNKKWSSDVVDEILSKHHLGGPGSADELCANLLYDLYHDYADGTMPSKEEIKEEVKEFIESYKKD